MKQPMSTDAGQPSAPAGSVSDTKSRVEQGAEGVAPAQPSRDHGDPAAPEHERSRRISEAAYYKAERRGFTPGEEQTDWLDAEKEVDGDDSGKLRPEDNSFPTPK